MSRGTTETRLWDRNWMQVEEYLRGDDRVAVPLGSTEQHGYLSLGVDAILAERAALEAASPLGIPVIPVVPFGLTPSFTAYPGTIDIRPETYFALAEDILDSLAAQGFRRILLVNGHGGNLPLADVVAEWTARNPGREAIFHSWLVEPEVWEMALEIDEAGHASWVENFPAVRLDGVAIPHGRKPLVDPAEVAGASPERVRELLGDGPGGGPYQRPDADTERIWKAAIELLRERLESGWNAKEEN
ncbi:MAG TPA: creatininase family protein [Solirubrobacterales bacterium]